MHTTAMKRHLQRILPLKLSFNIFFIPVYSNNEYLSVTPKTVLRTTPDTPVNIVFDVDVTVDDAVEA